MKIHPGLYNECFTMNNTSRQNNSFRFAVAPMMDHTDRHFRYLLRLISRHAFLYTEMITCNAILFGDHARLLSYSPEEHPLGIQLGGSDPVALTRAAKIAEDYGYDEININIGCPSERVQNGSIGACLMKNPDLVGECISSLQNHLEIPVSVKCRIGIDDLDTYEFLHTFIDTVHQAGCRHFIIHARKAILNGLSPKQNREVPPLHYDQVYRIKQDFPDINIMINGELKDLSMIKQQYQYVDGVMVGRAVYEYPYMLSDIDREIFNDPHPVPSQIEILEAYLAYISKNLAEGIYLKHMTRHLTGLFRGQQGAKQFRQTLSTRACKPDAGIDVVLQAMQKLQMA